MEKRQAYNKTYYTMNKQKMVKQIVDSRRSIINSDDYIETNRARVIDELNNGTRKFIHLTTLRKYRININPVTLEYYHDESYLNKMD